MSDVKGPRYKIEREIGRGAFGIVYLARDNVLRREVALKVMVVPDGLSAAERKHLVDRFYREARAAACLSHPNIVTIHDISKARDRHFISMEFLRGRPLSEVISGEPLEISRAVFIADGVLAALEYAHGNEVVHRDIKPDNIFLMDNDEVKLVDFGLARVQAATTITMSGAVMGSPGYIAPEVIDGKTADMRTDIFSFGVVFYEMLTGRRPFGPSDAFESFVRVIYRIMSEEPEPPSVVDDGVPQEIDRFVSKMLAKDPEDRYQDAAEARAALAALREELELPAMTSHSGKAGRKQEDPGGEHAGTVKTARTGDASASPDRSEALRFSEAGTEIVELEDDLRIEERRPKRRRRWIAVLSVAGIAAIAGITVLALFLAGVFGNSEASVPNVVNLNKADAESTIRRSGLKVGKVEDVFAYDIWKGKVASQKPSAGTRVPAGSTVDIKVSMGSEVAQVPNVVGMPKDQAAATISAFTFNPKLVTGYSETVPVGCVVSQNPASGVLRASRTTVTLVVNSGVRPRIVPRRSTPAPARSD